MSDTYKHCPDNYWNSLSRFVQIRLAFARLEPDMVSPRTFRYPNRKADSWAGKAHFDGPRRIAYTGGPVWGTAAVGSRIGASPMILP